MKRQLLAKLPLWLCCPRLGELFGIRMIAVGEYERDALPRPVVASFEHLAGDGLSLWWYPRLAQGLSASGVGIVFLGGAFLEEELLITALEGARHRVTIFACSPICRWRARKPTDPSFSIGLLTMASSR